MATENWHRGRLDKLTREQLQKELLDLVLRCDAAEDHFLFAGGRKGQKAEQALYIIRPALRHTKAAPQSDQIVYGVWQAKREGLKVKDAIAKVAMEFGIAVQSVKATYYQHKGPNGLPKR